MNYLENKRKRTPKKHADGEEYQVQQRKKVKLSTVIKYIITCYIFKSYFRMRQAHTILQELVVGKNSQ